MKTLATTYGKNGHQFNLVQRDGDVAIYAQDEPANYFEVFEVQKNKERFVGGRFIEASESTPSNEQWGQQGFTVYGILAANKKAKELREKIDRRKNRLAQ